MGVAQAYEEMHQAANDPAAAAIAALLQVDSVEALAQAIEGQPALLELPTLEQMTGLVEQAQAAGAGQEAAGLLARLAMLIENYNYQHAETIEPAAHRQFITLHERLLPLAEELGIDELTAGLHRSAGWACNTLGNHYADADKNLEKAVEAYTRGLAFDPENAMLLRNRAGTHLDRVDLEAARADIESAAALEPEAARLPELRAQLEALSRAPGGESQ
ncbi:MAG: hypothetical protein ACE5LU_05840 [Anaerolineae bacterium]